jgi:hypothetical protein
MNRPPQICDRHWQEWKASAIAQAIALANQSTHL